MSGETEPVAHAVRITFGSHEFQSRASPRALTEWEREVLSRLLSSDQTLDDVARSQADSVQVAEECRDCPSVILTAATNSSPIRSPASPGETRFGAAGAGMQAVDRDGTPVLAVAHIREGYIAELEVIRADGGLINELPTPADFALIDDA